MARKEDISESKNEAEKTSEQATSQQSDPKLDKLLAETIQSIKQQDYVMATTRLEQLEQQADTDYAFFHMIYFYYGMMEQQQQHHQKAIDFYLRCLEIKPDYATAYNNLGNAYKNVGKFNEAIAAFNHALEYKEDYFEAWYNLGNLYAYQGLIDEAEHAFKKSIEINPKFVGAIVSLSQIYQQRGKINLAIEYMQQAVELAPMNGQLAYQAGILAQQHGHVEQSTYFYQKAIDNQFASAELFSNLGVAFHSLGRSQQDILDCYQRAIQIDPQCASAYSNMGKCYERYQEDDQALLAYEKALAINPNLTEAHYNIGCIQRRRDQFPEAIVAFEKSIETNPNYSGAIAMLINALQHVADWDRVDKLFPRLVELTEKEIQEGGAKGITAFGALMLPFDNKMLLDIAKSTAQQYQKVHQQAHFDFARNKEHKKIRIGYISSDFTRNHPVGFLVNTIFGLHNTKNFDIYGYGIRKFDNGSSEYIESSFPTFRNLSDESNKKAAEIIYNDEIDILIDLSGYTEFARQEILATQPAPIQCQYLGYPGTMGADYIHYYLTHKVMTPPEYAEFFTEKFIFLPECHFATFPQAEPEECPKRIHFTLPDDAFVFCCFNTVQRIDSRVFKSWMNILSKVPNSVMWLQDENRDMRNNLRNAAEKHGVDPKRLVFSQYEALSTRWRHRLADLWLDTFTLSGGTSGILCANAGLPVLTLAGETTQSRTGAGVAIGADMPKMIVNSVEEYEEKAIDLALHPRKLKRLRNQLKKNLKTMPLFQPQRYIDKLETAYEMMWKQYKKDEQPFDHIEVP